VTTTRSVTDVQWVALLLTAALAALAWTWLITWFISRFGNYEEQDNETEQP
jgi:sensor domain CHASE-containing protein